MKRRNLLKLALITPVVAPAFTKITVSEPSKIGPLVNRGREGSADEIVIYDRILSPYEVGKVHTFLEAKYGT
jgi:hypothetical protein